jgi:ribonuclease P protein component
MLTEVTCKYPPSLRIRKRADFKRLQGGTKKHYSTHLLVIMNPCQGPTSRLGITITTKVDKRATQRNRIKRVIREFFRLNHSHLAGTFDIIVIARQNAAQCSSDSIRAELRGLLLRNRYLTGE